jgi:Tol biopolymer transport system component
MPVISPNGKRVAFMSFREGYCSVFTMTIEGEEPVNLTPKDAADLPSKWCSRAPSWSVNGGEIFFMS